MQHDETDTYAGDILNGVGSASSTSTISSIFSDRNAARSAGAVMSTTLTPLTNTESSPRAKVASPSFDGHNYHATSINGTISARGNMTPQLTPPANKQSARPYDLEIKGSKCTYDPELDNSIPSKERRKLKPTFEEFGSNPDHNVAPSDPRLAIHGYTKAVAGRGKAKLRIAPHNLRAGYREQPAPP